MGITWQGITHDLSKFLPSEFWSSAKYWTGVGSPVEAERNAIGYSLAWRFHKGRPQNRHHWQWFIDPDGWDDEGRVILNPAPMPEKYIKEMVCDMRGAARAYGSDTVKYYLAKQKEWVLHPDTKKQFEFLLGVTGSKYYISAYTAKEATDIAKERNISRGGWAYIPSNPLEEYTREKLLKGLKVTHPDYLIGYFTQAERRYLFK